MKQEKIIQNNKLIAEFMGGIYDNHGQPNKYWEFVSATKPYPQDKDLHYHYSWDWLIPVVHKCLKYCHEKMLNEWENSFADKFLACSIEVMFTEVIEFINWYNKNK